MAKLADPLRHEIDSGPEAEWVIAPRSVEELVPVLRKATDHKLSVLIWGGGTHQGYGHRITPDLIISTAHLQKVIAWEPDDLTLVAEAGVPVGMVESMLAGARQTAVLPEIGGTATVGGVVAAGVSGLRRARYGPTRDRVLEVTVVTGDGRVVRGGGRVVKNVTGYDLPRLVAGSFGALGLLVSVCLKLWPTPEAAVTIDVDDALAASAKLYRPLAVLEQRERSTVYLAGTRAEVEAQARRVGGSPREGLDWPQDPSGPVRWSLRVPPSFISEAIDRVPTGWDYLAQYGVGEIRLAGAEGALELRRWAESVGGVLVLADGPVDLYTEIDPWGSPPPALDLQRRLIAGFDPARVLNPGRLPGKI
jgi:glycolate oxidase FAD binding subunit